MLFVMLNLVQNMAENAGVVHVFILLFVNNTSLVSKLRVHVLAYSFFLWRKVCGIILVTSTGDNTTVFQVNILNDFTIPQ